MEATAYYFWLAREALGVAIVLLPVFMLLGVTGLIVATIAAVNAPQHIQLRWVWLLFPFVIPAIILAIGVVFRYQGAIGTAPAWPEQLIDALILSHIPLGIALTFLARRNPMVAIGLTMFQLWLSYAFGAMSGMSVSNIWL